MKTISPRPFLGEALEELAVKKRGDLIHLKHLIATTAVLKGKQSVTIHYGHLLVRELYCSTIK